MSKTPGMLMNTINTNRTSNKIGQKIEELDENTDELNMHTDPDITSKIKAMEFKVKRGLSGN